MLLCLNSLLIPSYCSPRTVELCILLKDPPFPQSRPWHRSTRSFPLGKKVLVRCRGKHSIVTDRVVVGARDNLHPYRKVLHPQHPGRALLSVVNRVSSPLLLSYTYMIQYIPPFLDANNTIYMRTKMAGFST